MCWDIQFNFNQRPPPEKSVTNQAEIYTEISTDFNPYSSQRGAISDAQIVKIDISIHALARSAWII